MGLVGPLREGLPQKQLLKRPPSPATAPSDSGGMHSKASAEESRVQPDEAVWWDYRCPEDHVFCFRRNISFPLGSASIVRNPAVKLGINRNSRFQYAINLVTEL